MFGCSFSVCEDDEDKNVSIFVVLDSSRGYLSDGGCEVLCARHIWILVQIINTVILYRSLQLTMCSLNIPRRHFTMRAESSLEMPFNDKKNMATEQIHEPLAVSWWTNSSEVETADDSKVLLKIGELKADRRYQWTSFLGVASILFRRRTSRECEEGQEEAERWRKSGEDLVRSRNRLK